MQHFKQDEHGVWTLVDSDSDTEEDTIVGRGRESVIRLESKHIVRKLYNNPSPTMARKIERQFHNMKDLEHTGRVPRIFKLYKDGYTMEYLKGYITLRLAIKEYKKNKELIKEILRQVYRARLELGQNISISDMSEDNTLINIDTMDVKFIDIGEISRVPSGNVFDFENKIINLLGVNKLWKLTKKELFY